MRKVPLPDGARLFLYTGALAATITGSASNAANLVVSAANTLDVKTLVVIDSDDYPELTGRVARVTAATTEAITLGGINTSNIEKFPPGGTVSLIVLDEDEWQRLPYVPAFGLSGGELNTGSSSYLDFENDQEFRTGRTARRLEYSISWKEDGAARATLQAADGLESVHRLLFKDGNASYYVGELHYDDVPSTEKGVEQTTTSTVLLRGAPSNVAKV